jgi:hypothetical protein
MWTFPRLAAAVFLVFAVGGCDSTSAPGDASSKSDADVGPVPDDASSKSDTGGGSVPTSVQIIRQGQNINTATSNFSCVVTGKGGGSTFEANWNWLGWQSVSGATSYNIYRATNDGSYSLYDSTTASAAASEYSMYLTGLTNGGITYDGAAGIDSAYLDTAATGVIGATSGLDFVATANTNGTTSLVITSVKSGTVAVGQGVGGPNIPTGTTLVSGPGGAGTYTMSQAATGSATGETIGAVLSGNQGYTYYVTAVTSSGESAPSAFAYYPFSTNGGLQFSNGAFNSCLIAHATAPSKTPLGYSKALAWWAVEPSSGPVSNSPPVPSCSGYPSYLNAYSGWSGTSYNLNTAGYKYINLSVWTAASGAQLSGSAEICGDAPLVTVNATQMASYGPATLTQNGWSTYKVPLSAVYEDSTSGVTQSAFYKITWGISGQQSTTTPNYIEYWFSVN